VVGPSTAANKQKAPEFSIRLPLKTQYNDAPAPAYVPGDNKLPAVTVKGRNFYQPSECFSMLLLELVIHDLF